MATKPSWDPRLPPLYLPPDLAPPPAPFPLKLERGPVSTDSARIMAQAAELRGFPPKDLSRLPEWDDLEARAIEKISMTVSGRTRLEFWGGKLWAEPRHKLLLSTREFRRGRQACRLLRIHEGGFDLQATMDTSTAPSIAGDWWRLFEVILIQAGVQGRNPVILPPDAIRTLLGVRSLDRIEGSLEALRLCKFRSIPWSLGYMATDLPPLVQDWQRDGGPYAVHLSCAWLGDLQQFADGRGWFDWTTMPASPDGKKRWKPNWRWCDGGFCFHAKALGMDPAQVNLLHWMASNVTTRRGEPVPFRRANFGYLPHGEVFVGILGNFRAKNYRGFSLAGRPSRKKGGGFSSGLMQRMTTYVPQEHPGRSRAVRRSFRLLRGLVEMLGGILGAKLNGEWISPERVQRLGHKLLARNVLFFIFLPLDWRQRLDRAWEERQEQRARKGQSPLAWKLEHGLALEARLHVARTRMALTQEEMAKRLGFSRSTLALIETGRRKIPRDKRSGLETWVKAQEDDLARTDP